MGSEKVCMAWFCLSVASMDLWRRILENPQPITCGNNSLFLEMAGRPNSTPVHIDTEPFYYLHMASSQNQNLKSSF